MATYVVTGGAGFIGSHIAHELVRRGQRVRIIDNFSTGKHANRDGKCNRKYTADGRKAQARVKWCGKSAPAVR